MKKNTLLSALVPPALLAAALLCNTSASAAVFDVCPSGCTYRAIQSAIDDAVSGVDTVLVGDGTYREALRVEGKGIVIQSVNGAASTILDGLDSRIAIRFIDTGAEESTLAGFTVMNGAGLGGGIDCQSSTLTVRDCIITANSNGVAGIASTLTLESCSVRDNTGGIGGGIYVRDSSLTLTDCEVNNNNLTNSGGGPGGGIFSDNSTVVITGGSVSNNSAVGLTGLNATGGGIHLEEGSVATISDCVINGNEVRGSGGGIYASDSSLSLTRCDISDNDLSSQACGAGICVSNTALLIDSCTLRGNSYANGGALSVYGSAPATIVNSVITGNRGVGGGGVKCSSSSPFIVNTTISGNVVSGWGGGMDLWDCSPTIVNSILRGNGANVDDDEMKLGGTSAPTIVNSNIGGGWPGNIDEDPLFVDPRPISEAPTSGGDYHLRPLSPCTDGGTGDTVSFPLLPVDDIDGDARPYGGGYDIGADEYTVNRLWIESVDLGSGWRWLDWFGYFNVNNDPWIYHMEHHWMYPFGTMTDNFTLWDSAMGAFWWTTYVEYPYLYRFLDDEWLFYSNGAAPNRWFVRMSDGGWERW